jgi:hypothetical protein
MGQHVLFNYPMVSSMVPTTLLTPYIYPMGHHSQSFVSKNDQRLSKTGFWRYLPQGLLILHTCMFYGPTCVVQLSYGNTQGANYTQNPIKINMGHYRHSFVTKNSQKLLKNLFLTMFTSITSYSAHKYVQLVNEWCQIILWYHPRRS